MYAGLIIWLYSLVVLIQWLKWRNLVPRFLRLLDYIIPITIHIMSRTYTPAYEYSSSYHILVPLIQSYIISRTLFIGSTIYILMLLIIIINFQIVIRRVIVHISNTNNLYNVMPIFPLQKCSACSFLRRWLQLLIWL